MTQVIVSDTSPINYLVLIEAVDLLPRLFRKVIIPPAVEDELSRPDTPERVRIWLRNPPEWLQRRTPIDIDRTDEVDPGETEAIALAEEIGNCALLMDDFKARRAATERGISLIGTLSVLEQASSNGWINFDEYADRLQATNFRIYEGLIADARQRLAALSR